MDPVPDARNCFAGGRAGLGGRTDLFARVAVASRCKWRSPPISCASVARTEAGKSERATGRRLTLINES